MPERRLPSRLARVQRFLSFQPPAVGEEEVAAAADAIRSGWLTSGPRAAELERRAAESSRRSTCSRSRPAPRRCTWRCSRVGVGPGDEVITTSLTWPATANVIVHCGATPVFADVRPADLNIDPGRVRRAGRAEDEGDRAGRPLRPAGRPRPAARARRAGRRGRRPRLRVALPRPQGRRRSPAATCFSLYATKNVAAGEGGLSRRTTTTSRRASTTSG